MGDTCVKVGWVIEERKCGDSVKEMKVLREAVYRMKTKEQSLTN